MCGGSGHSPSGNRPDDFGPHYNCSHCNGKGGFTKKVYYTDENCGKLAEFVTRTMSEDSIRAFLLETVNEASKEELWDLCNFVLRDRYMNDLEMFQDTVWFQDFVPDEDR